MKKNKKNGRPRYAHLGDNCTQKNNTEHLFAFKTLGGPGFFGMPPVWSQRERQTATIMEWWGTFTAISTF